MVAQKTKDEFLAKQKNQFWAAVVLLKTKKNRLLLQIRNPQPMGPAEQSHLQKIQAIG